MAAPLLSQTASEPALSVGSPRTRASMRVLGIIPPDVRYWDVQARCNGEEPKQKLFEQKRINLMSDVKRKADLAAEVTARNPLEVGLSRAERNAKFMEQVAQAERENMARMQRLAKKDVQNVVIAELETKLAAHRTKKKQEESQARMKDLLKSRDDELAARKKAAEKKQERIQDVRNKALQTMLEHSLELQETLRQNNDRAERQIQAIKEGRLAGREQNQEQRLKIYERQEGFADDLYRTREMMYAEHCEKMDSKVRMLEDRLAARQSHAEEIAEKERKCRENVRAHQEQKQAEAEEKYWAVCDRHGVAAKKREEDLRERTKAFQARNTKRKQVHDNLYDRIQRDIELDITRKYEEFEKKDTEFEKTRALAKASSDAQLQAFFDHRRHHTDLAAWNRERLRRAHHFAVEQQVDKLAQMRKKVQIMQNAKAEADHRRTVVMAKCAVEKMHLTDRVDRVKDSKDPDKIMSMLEELDPDPEAIVRINELLSELGMQTLGVPKEEEEGK